MRCVSFSCARGAGWRPARSAPGARRREPATAPRPEANPPAHAGAGCRLRAWAATPRRSGPTTSRPSTRPPGCAATRTRSTGPIMPRPFKVYADLEPLAAAARLRGLARWPALAAIADAGRAAARRPGPARRSPTCSTSPPACCGAGRIPAARSSSAPPPAPARSTTSTSMWCARPAGSRRPASTTSARTTSRCAGCAPATTAPRSSPRRPASRRCPRRAGRARLHQHVLAQRLEVPRADLPALLLGRRHHPREPARRRGRGRRFRRASC